jgi:hypothetical protein
MTREGTRVFLRGTPPLKIAAKIGCRERDLGRGRVGKMGKKTCAARGGRRVAAHKSSEHRGSCSRFHDVASQKAAPVGMLEQSPCQTSFSLQNNDLGWAVPTPPGDANCQVVTVGRRLRQQQTTLGLLLELAAETARGGLTRNVRLEPVERPS